MFEDVGDPDEHPVIARLDSVLDELTELDLTTRSDDQILGLLRGIEARTRRLAVVDQALVAQAERRGLAPSGAAGRPRRCWSGLLRVSPHEAAGRVAAAARAGPAGVADRRRRCPPQYPQTAAAQAAGAISAAHARIVTTTIDRLRPTRATSGSTSWSPSWSRRHSSSAPDPGQHRSSHGRDPRTPTAPSPATATGARHLTLQQRPDGSSSGTFELTAHATEALLTVLDATAAPRPSTAGPRRLGSRHPHGRPAPPRRAARRAAAHPARRAARPPATASPPRSCSRMTADQAATVTGWFATGHGAAGPGPRGAARWPAVTPACSP